MLPSERNNFWREVGFEILENLTEFFYGVLAYYDFPLSWRIFKFKKKKKFGESHQKKKTREIRRLSEALSRGFEATGRQPVVDLPPLPIVSVDICLVSPENINSVSRNAHESTDEHNSIFDHLRTQNTFQDREPER